MKFNQSELINDLIVRTKENIRCIKEFENLDDETLNWKPSPESWSVLECMEHLNRYGDFYIPEIRSRIAGVGERTIEDFKSGWLGNYFANSMLPKQKLNKMKTLKSMNPSGSQLDRVILRKFTDHQNQILDLLNESRKLNLTKIKTAISISKWIKLRLGDTFRVVIYHNQRHIAQAKRVIQHYSH